MAKKLRVAVLGAGVAGKGHITAYLREGSAQVVGLWSRKRATAESAASELEVHDATVFDHWQDMIEQSECDIVSVATPPTLRLEPLALALEHDCHVLLEVPFAIGIDEPHTMAEIGSTTKTVTAVTLKLRYQPGTQFARREIHDGRIGRILSVSADWQYRLIERAWVETRPWSASLDLGDGGEASSYQFDTVRFVTGQEFESIVTRFGRYHITQDGSFPVDAGYQAHTAELTGGAFASVRQGVTAGIPLYNRFEFQGESGSMSVLPGSGADPR